MDMDANFVQNVVMAAVAMATAVFGLFRYLKTGEKEGDSNNPGVNSDTSTVVAASFLDNKVLKELIEAIRAGSEEYAREGRKLARTRSELIAALEEASEAVLANTDALVNMVRFLKRQEAKIADNDTE